MAKIKIVVKTFDGDYEVEALPIRFAKFPNHKFAIHESVGNDMVIVNKTWTVTHVETGFHVAHSDSKELAKARAKRCLNEYTDSSFTEYIKSNMEKLLTQVRPS